MDRRVIFPHLLHSFRGFRLHAGQFFQLRSLNHHHPPPPFSIFQATPHHTTPHHTTPHHTTPHYTTPHHTTPHYTTLHHTTPHHTTEGMRLENLEAGKEYMVQMGCKNLVGVSRLVNFTFRTYDRSECPINT